MIHEFFIQDPGVTLFGNNELLAFFKRNKFLDPESIFRATKCASLKYS